MTIGENKTRVSLVLDADDKKLLQELADKEDRSLNYIVNKILRQYIASQKQDPK